MQGGGDLAPQARMGSVAAYFDREAEGWRDLYGAPATVNDQVLRDRKDTAIEFCARYGAPGARFLDAGCGAGIASWDLVQLGHEVHGVDVSPKMIELCRSLFAQRGAPAEKFRFTCGDLSTPELAPASFDGILALGFLQYQADEHATLLRLRELLRPGGLLVISGPIRIRVANLFGLKDVLRRRPATELTRISTHFYDRPRFHRLLTATGFVPLESRRHGYADVWLPKPFDRVLNLFGDDFAIHRGLTRLSRMIPIDRFANDIVMAARVGTGVA